MAMLRPFLHSKAPFHDIIRLLGRQDACLKSLLTRKKTMNESRCSTVVFTGILVAFIAGLWIGYKRRPTFFKKYKVVFWITLMLLFLMGYETGSNAELFESLPRIGWWALVIAVSGVAGGFLFVFLFEQAMKKRKSL